MKNIFSFFLIIVLQLGHISCTHHSVKSGSPLLVGLSPDYPPYEFITGQKNVDGFDVEIVKLLEQKLNRKIEYKYVSFDFLFGELISNNVDFIISAISITQTRKELFNLIHYYGEDVNHLSLVSNKKLTFNDLKRIGDLKKINSLDLSIIKGTIVEQYAKDEGLKFNTFASTDDLLLQLKDQRSTKTIMIEHDDALILKNNFNHYYTYPIVLHDSQKLFGYGIGVSFKNQKLTSDIENAILQLKNEGKIKHLAYKWLNLP